MAGKLTLIGLTGYKQHGKSSVADHLVKKHSFTRLSFAGPLKAMADRINPVVGIHAYQDGDEFVAEPIHLDVARELHPNEGELKEAYPLYRLFLQRLGTEGLREIDDLFWIKLLDAELGSLYKAGVSRVVIDDARFPNEGEYFHAGKDEGINASLWQVTRPGAGIPDDTHASEAYVGRLGEERHLKNAGTIEELHDLVDAVVAPYLNEGN
ncbi:hypothetical protein AUR04nite_00730 [Glutamicibacter uratoxydans]|uniref:Adenylate kinase n=1 Tax=Glutamicibacter uratoxydans TaxID=43667 RepID=A0A4Y4DPP4_GLUUR|nr:hypothetical protein [Glutamicibacter uratoxydans]GED04541.1 hypothetical protein AUR04nite_00730 [Glutamicibacter uratoxydans]